jgi:hypothetical protein
MANATNQYLLGHGIDIFLYPVPSLLIPFRLPMTLYLIIVNAYLRDFGLKHFPFAFLSIS